MTVTTRSAEKRPDDFEDFWRRMKARLAETPPAWERIPDREEDGWRIDWIQFDSLGGKAIYGWVAAPADGPQTGLRGSVWLPGYSYGSPPPGPESLYPGTVTLGLNLHGNPPDTPYVHPATRGREYITQGIESPETYIFGEFVCHALRALEVLAEQPEVDSDRLIVGGMSQGGGLALLAAALAPQVRVCLADMPWLCDLDLALSLIDRAKYADGRRIPDGRAQIEDYADAHPELREQVFRTYRYFDPLSHAEFLRCPTQMSAGGRDPSCRPATIQSVYEAISAPKDLLFWPNVGHEIIPAMRIAHENWVNSTLESEGMGRKESRG